ncbi:MAG: YfhO family protein [bacterium]
MSAPVRVAAALAPVLLPALLLGPALVRGELIYGFDTLGELYPWWSWAWKEMARGVWPHWNPYVMCGLPFHGLAVVSLAYPLSLANLVLDVPRAITLWWLVHSALAGGFTQRFARALGASPAAAALAGVTYGASEALMSRIAAGELPQLAVVTWVPALLWIIESGIASGSALTLLSAAAPIALMLLAGHLQYVAYGSLVAATYAVARLAADRARRRQRASWLALAGAWMLGLALAAHQVLPTLDAISESHRAWGLARREDPGILLTPRSLSRLLVPDLLGNEYRGGYVGDTVGGQVPLYVGILPLVLAGCAIALRARHASRLALIALASLVFAFGSRLPLAPALEWLVPPLRGFRIPSRMLVIGALPLAVLAGLGLDAIRCVGALAAPRRAALGALAGLGLVTAALLALIAASEPWATRVWRAWVPDVGLHRSPEALAAALAVARAGCLRAGLLVIVSGACVVWLGRARAGASRRAATLAALTLTAIDLGVGARDWIRPLPPELGRMATAIDPLIGAAGEPSDPAGARVLARVAHRSEPIPETFLTSYGIGDESGEIVPNWLAARDLRTVTGEIGLIPARTVLFTGNAGRYRIAGVEHEARLDLLGVTRVVTDPEPGSIAVARRQRALPLVALASRVRRVASADAALAQLDAAPGGSIDPRQEALVESGAPLGDLERAELSAVPGTAAVGTAAVLTLDTQQLTVAVDAARPALLVVLDPYDPRWRATVDGATTPILPTQLMFRGVPVPAGHHLVRMRYVPRPFQLGVALTSTAAATTLLAGALRRRFERGSRVPS